LASYGPAGKNPAEACKADRVTIADQSIRRGRKANGGHKNDRDCTGLNSVQEPTFLAAQDPGEGQEMV
jgi:hypothetical protein